MTISICLALALLRATARAQSLPRVQTAEAVVAKLGPELGEKISISTPLKNCLVLVDRHGATAEATLRALCVALESTVVSKGTRLELVQTTQNKREFETRRAVIRGEWIRNRIAAVRRYRAESLTSEPSGAAVLSAIRHDAQEQERYQSGRQPTLSAHFASDLLPAQRLLLDLITRIGVERIARVPTGRCEVFEDEPVESAHELPEHERELSVYERSESKLRQTKFESAYRFDNQSAEDSPAFLDWAKLTSMPRRLRLQVRAEDSEIVVTLEGFDEHGGLSTVATFIAMSAFDRRSPSAASDQLVSNQKSEWIPVSDRALAATHQRAEFSQVSPSWVKRPDLNEPLDLFVREALGGLDEKAGSKCFVFALTDQLWPAVKQTISQNRVNLNSLQIKLRDFAGFERINTQGSEVWRSVSRLAGDSDVCNRRAMARLFTKSVSSATADIRTIASFHAEEGRDETLLGLAYGRMGLNHGDRGSLDGLDHWLLAALGKISDEDWQSLLNGRMMTADQLGIDESLTQAVRDDKVEVQRDGPIPALYEHASELFRKNDPSEIPVRARTGRLPMVWLRSTRHPAREAWMPEPYFAKVAPIPLGAGPSYTPRISREVFERGLGRSFELRLGYAPTFVVTLGLPFGCFSRGSWTGPPEPLTEPMKYTDLPQRYRDDLWNAALAGSIEKAKSMHLGG